MKRTRRRSFARQIVRRRNKTSKMDLKRRGGNKSTMRKREMMNSYTEEMRKGDKIVTMTGKAMMKLQKDAKEHVFQNYPSTSPVLRNLILKNAKNYGITLTPNEVEVLKQNGDITTILVPYGRPRVRYQNQEWTISPYMREQMMKALESDIPLKVPAIYGQKLNAYMRNKYGNSVDGFIPFSNLGSRELEILLKQEELMWEQYLNELVDEYVEQRRDTVIANVKKNVDDEMLIDKHGLTGLKI